MFSRHCCATCASCYRSYDARANVTTRPALNLIVQASNSDGTAGGTDNFNEAMPASGATVAFRYKDALRVLVVPKGDVYLAVDRNGELVSATSGGLAQGSGGASAGAGTSGSVNITKFVRAGASASLLRLTDADDGLYDGEDVIRSVNASGK